jgi:mannitol-1-phosphate/altronate dehydrogenase
MKITKFPAPRWAALVAAAWAWFIAGRLDGARELQLDDPFAEALRRAVRSASPDALLAIEAVSVSELAGEEVFRRLVASCHAELSAHGVADLLAGLGEKR